MSSTNLAFGDMTATMEEHLASCPMSEHATTTFIDAYEIAHRREDIVDVGRKRANELYTSLGHGHAVSTDFDSMFNSGVKVYNDDLELGKTHASDAVRRLYKIKNAIPYIYRTLVIDWHKERQDIHRSCKRKADSDVDTIRKLEEKVRKLEESVARRNVEDDNLSRTVKRAALALTNVHLDLADIATGRQVHGPTRRRTKVVLCTQTLMTLDSFSKLVFNDGVMNSSRGVMHQGKVLQSDGMNEFFWRHGMNVDEMAVACEHLFFVWISHNTTAEEENIRAECIEEWKNGNESWPIPAPDEFV